MGSPRRIGKYPQPICALTQRSYELAKACGRGARAAGASIDGRLNPTGAHGTQPRANVVASLRCETTAPTVRIGCHRLSRVVLRLYLCAVGHRHFVGRASPADVSQAGHGDGGQCPPYLVCVVCRSMCGFACFRKRAEAWHQSWHPTRPACSLWVPWSGRRLAWPC